VDLSPCAKEGIIPKTKEVRAMRRKTKRVLEGKVRNMGRRNSIPKAKR
jgi:hypothetical protein